MKRRRIKIVVAAPVLVGLIITVAFSAYIFVGVNVGNRIIRDRLVQDNHALLSISSNIMFNPLYELDVWTLNNLLNELIREDDIVQATIRDRTGNIVTQSSTGEITLDERQWEELAAQAQTQDQIVQYEANDYLILSGPISAGSEKIGALEIVFSLASLNTSIIALFASMLVTGLGTLLIAIIIASILTQFFQKPINNFVEAANQIGMGNLDVIVPDINLEEPATIGFALHNMQKNLKSLYEDYEQQVVFLERRAKYLEATSVIAREMASVLDLPALLSRAIQLIDEKFGYYRQGIFLVDPSGEQVVLHAASGAAIEKSLERGFRVMIGGQGIVAHVAASKEYYVVQNVHEDPLFLSDDDTIITQSELALPLHSRGEIIGVLDVQSAYINAFTNEDISVLQTLADQIALAITNARLFEESQENLNVVQRAYGELSREKWSEMLESRGEMGYYSDENRLIHISEYNKNTDPSDDNLPTIDIPIVVRGYLIGKISACKPQNAGKWSEEEIELMEDMTEQLNLAIESARLYEDSQSRAAQEQLTSEITTRIRETLDLETIIETAVNEIGSAMGLSALEVHLGSFSSNDQEQ